MPLNMVSDKENDDNYQILIVKIIVRLRMKGNRNYHKSKIFVPKL